MMEYINKRHSLLSVPIMTNVHDLLFIMFSWNINVNFQQSSDDLQQKIEERIQQCKSLGITMQPLVVAVTPTEGTVESCHIVIDNTSYKTTGLIRTLDISFKIVMALDAEYNIESKYAYLFLQRFFYDIKTKNDKMTSAISNLIGKLETSLK